MISCCERLRTSGGSYMSRGSLAAVLCLLCVRFNSALFVSVGGRQHACVDGITEIKPNRRPTGPPPADMHGPPTSRRSRRVSTLPVGSARSLPRWFSPSYVNRQFDKSNSKRNYKTTLKQILAPLIRPLLSRIFWRDQFHPQWSARNLSGRIPCFFFSACDETDRWLNAGTLCSAASAPFQCSHPQQPG